MELQKKLEKSGLSEKEAIIYEYLITHGGGNPGKISVDLNMNRGTVYSILGKMSVQGLVSEIKKGKKKFFQIERPERLVNAANYKKRIAEECFRYAEALAPTLNILSKKISDKSKVSFHDTHQAVVEAYMEHVEINEKYEMLAFFNYTDLGDFFPKDKLRHYFKEKERLGINVRVLSYKGDNIENYRKSFFTGVKKSIWPQVKIIPEQIFPFPGEITLYGNNSVSIVKFDKENPVAVIIHDTDVYKMLKSIFEILWTHATQEQ